MSFRIAAAARSNLQAIYGQQVVSDGQLDRNEIRNGPLSADGIEATGARPGQPITALQGQMLLARAIASGLGNVEADALTPDQMRHAAERYEKIAAQTDDPAVAFEALSAAAAIYTKLGDDKALGKIGRRLRKAYGAVVKHEADRRENNSFLKGYGYDLKGWSKAQVDALLLHQAQKGVPLHATLRMIEGWNRDSLARPGSRFSPELVLRALELGIPSDAVGGIASAVENGPADVDPERVLTVVAEHSKRWPGNPSDAFESGARRARVVMEFLRPGRPEAANIDEVLTRLVAPPLGNNDAVWMMAAVLVSDPNPDPLGVVQRARAVVLGARLTPDQMTDRTAEAFRTIVAGIDDPVEIQRTAQAVRQLRPDQPEAAAVMVAALVAQGQTPTEAIANVRAALNAMPWAKDYELMALSTLMAKGMSSSDAVKLVLLMRVGGEESSFHMSERLRAVEMVSDLCDAQGITDPEERLRVTAFVLQYGGGEAEELVELLSMMGVPVAQVSREGLPTALAQGVDRLVAEGKHVSSPLIFAQVARVINTVHAQEEKLDRSDSIRVGFAEALSPQGAYTLLGAGGEALFTSSFLLIFAGLEKKLPGDAFSAQAATLDPSGALVASFASTVSRYGKHHFLVANREVILDSVLAELDTTSAPLETAARMLPFFVGAFPKLDAADQRRVEAVLVGTMNNPNATAAERAAAAFILRNLFEQGAPLSAEVKTQAEALPPLPASEPPVNKWLEDGKVTAKMYVYPDEMPPPRGWLSGKVAFFRAQGFTIDRKASPNPDKELVLVRKRNGVEQRLIVTWDPNDSREESLNSPAIDIVAHRSHSYHFSKTFPPNPGLTGEHPKIILGGSCGSYGSMTSDAFLAQYGSQYLIADLNTGHAAVNNRMMLRLLNGIADGKTDWDEYGLGGYVQKQGVRLPSDPTLNLGRYFSAYVAHAGIDVSAEPEALTGMMRQLTGLMNGPGDSSPIDDVLQGRTARRL